MSLFVRNVRKYRLVSFGFHNFTIRFSLFFYYYWKLILQKMSLLTSRLNINFNSLTVDGCSSLFIHWVRLCPMQFLFIYNRGVAFGFTGQNSNSCGKYQTCLTAQKDDNTHRAEKPEGHVFQSVFQSLIQSLLQNMDCIGELGLVTPLFSK